MSILIQSIVNGLNQGAIYALIALGYTMVYGILRMINFAHGDFIMVGAYTMFYTVPLMVSIWDAGMDGRVCSRSGLHGGRRTGRADCI